MTWKETIKTYLRTHPWQSATEIAHGISHSPGSVASTLTSMYERTELKRSAQRRGVRNVWIYALVEEQTLEPEAR